MRVDVNVEGKKSQAALDQIRCLDKSGILNQIGKLSSMVVRNLKRILKEYLVE